MLSPTPRVVLRSISKAFNGVPALREVDVEFRAGEVTSLCGENGAGKSTLIEILAGHLAADTGLVEIDGKPARFRSPADALAHGIAVIHQEFSLVDDLTVAENLCLGAEPRFGPFLNRRAMIAEAEARLSNLGFAVPARAKAGRLLTGERQLVEIAKALGREAKILILDEPTAALTRHEAERLFEVIRQLRANGLAIVYVSHHLDEVLALSDSVVVLRDGRKVGTWPARDLTAESLVSAMVGEAVDLRTSAPRSITGPPRLKVEGLSGRVLRSVDLAIAPGEILGVTGLAGAGHEELGSILFGAQRPTEGRVWIDGTESRFRHPSHAIAAGLASVPGDRRRQGLLSTLDIEQNITICQLPALGRGGWVGGRARKRLATALADEFEVARARLSQRATTLSGGNQQKVILARWSANRPKILILNDPTRGIDVKTREAIHRWVEDLASSRVSILLITSDIHELRRLADRVLVFRRGRVARQGPIDELVGGELVAGMTEESPAEDSN